MDRISDLAYDPIDEAEEDDKQEKIVAMRQKLKKGVKNNGNDNKT